jgi:hypothetical protein
MERCARANLNVSRALNTRDATPVRQDWLQPLISGFMALSSATVGEPTGCRQRALRLRRIGGMEPWRGVLSSL